MLNIALFRKIRHRINVALLMLAACTSLQSSAEESSKPNIIIILADDLGWRDVSYHGGPIKTPNIDSIARDGVKLERFYVHPICSPTRAALMTGRYPIRFGYMKAVPFGPYKMGMSTEEVTLADMLANAGYKHRGAFGKWHLGHSHIKYHPMRRGFTEFTGCYEGGLDYFNREMLDELDWHTGYESNHDQGYTTDLIGDAAVNFINAREGDDDPFFLYVPFTAPHFKFQAKEEDLPLYEHLGPIEDTNWGGATSVRGEYTIMPTSEEHERKADLLKKRKILGAMMHSLDREIGRILNALEESGAADNTLLMFLSDNGGHEGVGSNHPYRGAKSAAFEGGVRVPGAIRWPGHIEPGTETSLPLSILDVMPTLMNVAGIEDHGGKPLDGIDILDVLTGNQTKLDRELYNYIGQAGPETEQISYTTNEWKLLIIGPQVNDDTLDDAKRRKMLFNLQEDPYETTNLAADHPELVEDMYNKLREFRGLMPEVSIPPFFGGHEKGLVPPKEWKLPED